MKPAPFEYFAPTDLSEALALLSKFASDAKVLAGGQSLIPLMNFRLAQPSVIVDIGRIEELRYVRLSGGHLEIGAMATHADLEESDIVSSSVPILNATAPLIGHIAIRTRGTLAGSLAHADPAAEWPMVCCCLDVDCVLMSARGVRTVKASDLFMSYFTTIIEPDEILTQVNVPARPVAEGWAVEEVTARHGDFAIVGVAALAAASGGKLESIRLSAAGVDSVPRGLPGLEIFAGAKVDELDLNEMSHLATTDLKPPSDGHASADYRKDVAAVLAKRAIRAALSRTTAIIDAGMR